MRKSMLERSRPLYEHDLIYYNRGVVLAGMDEVGRGPLAGNVVAACVVLPCKPWMEGVNDSKQLSERAREELYARIIDTAVFARVGEATPREIDDINILEATRLAMCRAAIQVPADLLLVDAMEGLRLDCPIQSIIHGDAISYSIAAASIVAKVTRDRQLRALEDEYPGYGFAQHKGYGTQAHIEALRRLGPTPVHRRSFITKLICTDEQDL